MKSANTRFIEARPSSDFKGKVKMNRVKSGSGLSARRRACSVDGQREQFQIRNTDLPFKKLRGTWDTKPCQWPYFRENACLFLGNFGTCFRMALYFLLAKNEQASAAYFILSRYQTLYRSNYNIFTVIKTRDHCLRHSYPKAFSLLRI